jgi:hypothetical protein
MRCKRKSSAVGTNQIANTTPPKSQQLIHMRAFPPRAVPPQKVTTSAVENNTAAVVAKSTVGLRIEGSLLGVIAVVSSGA